MQITKEYQDNSALMGLTGPQNVHLKQIEQEMNVQIHMRGNQLTIEGNSRDVPLVSDILDALYVKSKQNGDIMAGDIDRVIAQAHGQMPSDMEQGGNLTLKTKKRHINPRTQTQADFIEAMNTYEMVFGLGPAGTGKTFLAVAKAVSMMLEGKVEKISGPNYLLKDIYVRYMTCDGQYVEDKEEHVWINDSEKFQKAGIKQGDCVSFSGSVYIYKRQNGSVDFSIKDLESIHIIDEYRLPTDEELHQQFLEQLRCEVCLAKDQCYGICIMR